VNFSQSAKNMFIESVVFPKKTAPEFALSNVHGCLKMFA
jgi:hypothetical protein